MVNIDRNGVIAYLFGFFILCPMALSIGMSLLISHPIFFMITLIESIFAIGGAILTGLFWGKLK